MQRLCFILALFKIALVSFGQKEPKSIRQKGFLFISAYNYRYDWEGYHMKPLGFHDFFFPGQDFDSSTNLDSTVFDKGIRVDFIPQRFYIKKKAVHFFGFDTSRCYPFDNFYIVPVQIDFREIEEYQLLECNRPSFAIQQGHTKRIFLYSLNAIDVKATVLYPENKKKLERLKAANNGAASGADGNNQSSTNHYSTAVRAGHQ